jgi:hypothetical protein
MIVRLGDSEYQTELIVFLRNSGAVLVERIDANAVRVADVDESWLAAVLETWRSLHPDVEAEMSLEGTEG